MTYYPNNLDDSISLPIATSGVDGGSAPDATSTVKGIVKLTNDFGGTANLPNVVGIQGKAIDSTAPTNGQVLTWDSSNNYWSPMDASSVSVSDATTLVKGIVQLAGDISGTATSVSVVKIQGRSVQNTSPTDKQVLTWNNAATRWEPQSIPNATTSIPGTVVLSGDIGGTYNALEINSLRGYAVSNIPPTEGQVFTYTADSEWKGVDLQTATSDLAGLIKLTKDLGGTYDLPTVVGLQGRSVSSLEPTANQVLTWDSGSSNWYPANIPSQPDATTLSKGLIQLAGDLSGTASSPTVVALRTYPISSTIPTIGDAIVFNGSSYNPTFIDGYSDLTISANTAQSLGTGSNTFSSIGAININSVYYESSIFIFESVIQATTGQTAEIRLYNLTDGSVVVGSTLSTTNTSLTKVSAIVILSGEKIYEAQIRITNSSPAETDGVYCLNSKIRVKYI